MHALTADERHRNRSQPIHEIRPSVSAAGMRRVPRGVTFRTNFRKDLVNALWIARRKIVAKIGFAQHGDDLIALLVRAIGEISASDRGREPRHWMSDLVAVDQEWTMAAARLADLHVI